MNWLVLAVLADSCVVITVGVLLKGWAKDAVEEGVHNLLQDGGPELAKQIVAALAEPVQEEGGSSNAE